MSYQVVTDGLVDLGGLSGPIFRQFVEPGVDQVTGTDLEAQLFLDGRLDGGLPLGRFGRGSNPGVADPVPDLFREGDVQDVRLDPEIPDDRNLFP